jgi:hypothetical protein
MKAFPACRGVNLRLDSHLTLENSICKGHLKYAGAMMRSDDGLSTPCSTACSCSAVSVARWGAVMAARSEHHSGIIIMPGPQMSRMVGVEVHPG